MIILSVTILMKDIRQMVRIRQEIFSNEAMDLEGLPLYADTPVSLTIVGSNHMPGGRIAQHITCRANRAIREDVVEGMTLLVEALELIHNVIFIYALWSSLAQANFIGIKSSVRGDLGSASLIRMAFSAEVKRSSTSSVEMLPSS